jgi:hypothetical protein
MRLIAVGHFDRFIFRRISASYLVWRSLDLASGASPSTNGTSFCEYQMTSFAFELLCFDISETMEF